MKKIFSLCITAIIFGCATPKLTNLHQGTFEVSTNTLENLIDVDVNLIPLPKAPPKPSERAKTFFDLNDSTQVHYLKALSSKIPDADDFIKALYKPLSTLNPSPSNLKTDYSKVEIKFFVNHEKKYPNAVLKNDPNKKYLPEVIHPNARIEWLNTKIEFVSDQWEIETIDKLQTLYETIHSGSLSREQSSDLAIKGSTGYDLGSNIDKVVKTVDISGNNPTNSNVINLYDEYGNLIGTTSENDSTSNSSQSENSDSLSKSRLFGSKAEASYGNKTAIKEGIELNNAKIKTGYTFNAKEIKIYQKGNVLRDVSSVETITATLKYSKTQKMNVYNFSNLYGREGLVSADNIKINLRKIKYIPCSSVEENIKIKVTYDGLFRGVRNLHRGKNQLEYDDKVVYYPINSSEEEKDKLNVDNEKTISILDYCKPFFSIKIQLKGEKYPRTLHDRITGNVVFMLWEENPQALKQWIEDVIGKNDVSLLKNNSHNLFFNAPIGLKELNFIGPETTEEDLKLLSFLDRVYLEEYSQ